MHILLPIYFRYSHVIHNAVDFATITQFVSSKLSFLKGQILFFISLRTKCKKI